MTAQHSQRCRTARRQAQPRGFTLIEMILVLALLVVVLSYAAPSLSHFFRGRNLDAEARRFLALTRYGQNRAVTEGIPMWLWVDSDRGRYGLKAQTGYVADEDRKALEFEVAPDLQLDVSKATATLQTNFWTFAPRANVNARGIWFLPDGLISETSLNRLLLRETRAKDAVWIVQSANRLQYELQTGDLPDALR